MKKTKGKRLGITHRLERDGWRLLTEERDQWRAKALAYKRIINRAEVECRELKVARILNEADKIKEGK